MERLGLLPLTVWLAQKGLGNIPAVTKTVLGLNVFLFMVPAAPRWQVCVSFKHVYVKSEWSRLLLSPLHHGDSWHLCLNMLSFIRRGISLEQRVGRAWFLYLLSVFYFLTQLVEILLQAGLTQLNDSDLLRRFINVSSHSSGCAIGFSGVLFALSAVDNYYNPDGVTVMFGFRVLNRHATWVELVLICIISPGVSLIGHLAGILVGRLYVVGPLETIMKTCAAFAVYIAAVLPRRRGPAPPSHLNEGELQDLRARRLRSFELN